MKWRVIKLTKRNIFASFAQQIVAIIDVRHKAVASEEICGKT